MNSLVSEKFLHPLGLRSDFFPQHCQARLVAPASARMYLRVGVEIAASCALSPGGGYQPVLMRYAWTAARSSMARATEIRVWVAQSCHIRTSSRDDSHQIWGELWGWTRGEIKPVREV
jgi:hypothetical protein